MLVVRQKERAKRWKQVLNRNERRRVSAGGMETSGRRDAARHGLKKPACVLVICNAVARRQRSIDPDPIRSESGAASQRRTLRIDCSNADQTIRSATSPSPDASIVCGCSRPMAVVQTGPDVEISFGTDKISCRRRYMSDNISPRSWTPRQQMKIILAYSGGARLDTSVISPAVKTNYEAEIIAFVPTSEGRGLDGLPRRRLRMARPSASLKICVRN